MNSLAFLVTCLILFTTGVYSSVIGSAASSKLLNAEPLGPCECAVFGKKDLDENDEPIIKQHPMNVSCPDAETCMKMCTSLALAAKASGQGPALLCVSVQHMDNLQPSVFTRSCGDQKWQYTGMTCTEPICCHEGAPVVCKTDNPAETPSEGAPSAGVPAAGEPAAGVPSEGVPSAGAVSAGAPTANAPSAEAPPTQ